MSCETRPVRRSTEYSLVPARSVPSGDLFKFAELVRPERQGQEGFAASWWRRADPACAVAALHLPSGAMAGLCCGRPAEWKLADRLFAGTAICDWYVAPGHQGQGLGPRMLTAFEQGDRLLYAFSISAAAIRGFKKLGWLGPHSSSLLAVVLPRAAHAVLSRFSAQPDYAFEPHELTPGRAVGGLGDTLDMIERQGSGPARMVRGAKEWGWRLSVCDDRYYSIIVASRDATPVGYVAVRRIARSVLGQRKAAIITDLVAANEDRRLLAGLAFAAVRLAGGLGVWMLLALATAAPQRRAFVGAGFVSPSVPVLGSLLRRRSPQFMWRPKGPGAQLRADAVSFSLADSDLDLNL